MRKFVLLMSVSLLATGAFGCGHETRTVVRRETVTTDTVPAQPVGFRPELPNALYESQSTGWAAPLVKRRPEITAAMADQFLDRMFRNNPDFVFTVTRDFVRSCRTPLLVLPDDIPPHPYAVAMEIVKLAPNAEASIYPWKESKDTIRKVVEHARTFLKAHEPVRSR